MSLRTRLLLIVLLALLLPVGLVGWRFFQERVRDIQEAQRALSVAAQNVGNELEAKVQGTAQLHYGLARARDLDTTDVAACSAFLAEVLAEQPQYTGLLTIRPDGSLMCDSLRSGRKLDLRDRGYFRRALSQPGQVSLEPVFGRITGLSVLQIAYPVPDAHGAVKSVLLASLNLDRFTKDRLNEFISPSPQVVLIDAKGLVLVWRGGEPGHPAPGASIAQSALFRFAQAPVGASVGEVVSESGEVQVWARDAAQATRRSGVQVLVGQSKAQLVASANRRLTQDLVLHAAIALLLFGGMWLLAEVGIRRPVGRISSMARRLGAGDLSARIDEPHPRGELGGLMSVFNGTADSLQRQRADIEALGQQLRQSQKLEAIGTLAGGIAHDFNNILGAILGNVALARDDLAPGHAAQRSLAQIDIAALRARDLVQQILAFSRGHQPALVTLPLRPLVEDIFGLMRVALPPGVSLHTDLTDEPLQVNADATQLHQVLMNLCANAWQSLQGRPGHVTVGLMPLTRAAAKAAGLGFAEGHAGDLAHLWVADTGCGMDEATRLRIFEPFFTTKTLGTGTGLGLSVVHGIVAAHGGVITVDSRPGQGSTFHVYLPTVDGDGSLPAAPPAAVPVPAWHGRGERVLYLDDDEVMKVLVERLLERAGYRPACHASAHEALAAVRAEPASWDLVVSDYNMPELSGIEFTRALQQIRPDLPVIIISGYVSEELRQEARAVGVRDVIQKQYTLEELGSSIQRVLAGAVASV